MRWEDAFAGILTFCLPRAFPSSTCLKVISQQRAWLGGGGSQQQPLAMESPDVRSPPVSRDILESYVVELASPSTAEQRRALLELRVLSKWHAHSSLSVKQAAPGAGAGAGAGGRRDRADVLNVIGDMGALPLLVRLMGASDVGLQENAVTVLHNLSVQMKNKERIIRAKGSLDAVLAVVSAGLSMAARENAASLLFSLLVVESFRETVGSHPGGIPSLMALYREGSARGKKDAIKALFHLSLCSANKGKVVEAGMVPCVLSLLEDGDRPRDREGLSVLEDALALLALLAASDEGQAAMFKCGGIPAMVKELQVGSPRSKEHAANTLLLLCEHGGDRMAGEVLRDLSVVSSLSVLQNHGTVRGRSKANALLKILVSTDSY